MGLILAYHNHDIELRNAAREFHHMMVGTDPANVTLCLDAHWVYRGAGNSQVALFDVLELYGPRVSELHLRQSQNDIWTEAFGPGDIDYERLAGHLLKIGIKPLLVLEQAVENGSPNTMKAVEAFRSGTGALASLHARQTCLRQRLPQHVAVPNESRFRRGEAFLDGVLRQQGHVVDVKLVHDAEAVGLDRLGTDEQLHRDLLGAVALGHQLQDLALPLRQDGERAFLLLGRALCV